MTETTHDHASLTIEWCDQTLLALGERGLFHAASGTLYVADVHLGKASYFRARGRPVPERVTSHDLSRLSRMIRETAASRLIILGDLFHAPPTAGDDTIASLRAWRDAHSSLECLLVKGNHDKRIGACLDRTGFEIITAPHHDGPFSLAHEPPERDASRVLTLCGHIHPSVRLKVHGRASIRASCFWFSDARIVLPAFGRFTGTHTVRPAQRDRVVVVDSSRVIEVSPAICIGGQ